MQQLGIQRKRTTSYHPAYNGAIERYHRTLKNSLRAPCQTKGWYHGLPLALLGIRATIDDNGFCPSMLVHGSSLDLPIHFFVPEKRAFKI